MKIPTKFRINTTTLVQSFTKEKDSKFPLLASIEVSLLIAVMAAFLFSDPFKLSYKTVDFLRLKFSIFVKEPKLLYYASIYMGSFLTKAIAISIIIALLMAQKVNIDENLAIRTPASKEWLRYISPFVIFSAGIRIWYSINPLMPNLPIRLVFPEAMVIGNTIIILSVLFIAPLTEEIIFRGYIFDVFKRSFGIYLSILLTSILFALAHLPQLDYELLDTGIIFILGFIFGILRAKTDSVLTPMAFHSLYNLVYITIGLFNYLFLGY